MYYHVAVAHRFDPPSVLQAYVSGFFPMGDEDGTIHWITSDPRFVLPIGGLRVSKSLRRLDRQRPFELRVDTQFRRVMEHCAQDRSEENRSWILPRMIDVYAELHRQGFAHSVEAWLGGVLVGGLYGVAIGGAFFGESMFHTVRDASKVALAYLVARLKKGGYVLLDTQFVTPHLSQFGAVAVRRARYRRMLANALDQSGTFTALADDASPETILAILNSSA